MANMNGRARKKWYAFLVKRDGHCCNGCGVSDKVKLLIIDHIDNNNNNNPPDGSNYQLLCKSCNALKDPKGSRLLRPSDYGRPSVTVISAQMQKNKEAEPKFVGWLSAYLREEDEIEYETCLVDGAYIADCSQSTVERYLAKHASQYGPFLVFQDDNETRFIRLRTIKPKAQK